MKGAQARPSKKKQPQQSKPPRSRRAAARPLPSELTTKNILDLFAAGKPIPKAQWGKNQRRWDEYELARALPLKWIHADTLPHWNQVLETERECLFDFDEALGEIDREIKQAELKAATAKREWMGIEIMYFGGWLGDRENRLRRRPADPEITFRDKRIAAHSLLLELEARDRSAIEGKRPQFESVVAIIEKLYGVKRSTIFSARKHWCPQLRKLGFDQSFHDRRRRLETLEWDARFFRSPMNSGIC